MQLLYEKQKSLFKDFKDFLSRKEHISEKRLSYHLRWVSHFHGFCSRLNSKGNRQEAFTTYLQDPSKPHEDLQVQQAREAVCP